MRRTQRRPSKDDLWEPDLDAIDWTAIPVSEQLRRVAEDVAEAKRRAPVVQKLEVKTGGKSGKRK